MLRFNKLYGILILYIYGRFYPTKKGRLPMAVTYKKLWHILLDRDMKKKDLQEEAGLTGYAMHKLSKNEAVTTDVLAKICRALDCTVDDIIDILPEDE